MLQGGKHWKCKPLANMADYTLIRQEFSYPPNFVLHVKKIAHNSEVVVPQALVVFLSLHFVG